MSKKYYVRGEQIDLDYWAIELDSDCEHDEENTDCYLKKESLLNKPFFTPFVTDINGKVLGVAWEMEL